MHEAAQKGGILVLSNATRICNEIAFVNNKAFEGTIVLFSSGAGRGDHATQKDGTGHITLYRVNLATVTISSNQAEFGGGTSAENAVITTTSLPSSPFHSLVLSNNTTINGDGLLFASNAH